MKKWIGILALTIAIGLLVCCTATADSEFVVQNGVLTAYNGPGGDVVIPGNLGIREIGDNVFRWNTSLTSVVIPEGVTIIGRNTFEGCYMTSVTLPESLRIIKGQSFRYNNFTSVIIPEGVEDLVAWTFSDCDFLTSIRLPGTLSSIDVDCFYNTNNLATVVCTKDSYAKNWAVGKGLSISYYTPLFDVRSHYLFKYNGHASTVVIPADMNIDTVGDYAFENNAQITSVVIPEGVVTIGGFAFYNTNHLRSVTFPSTLHYIGYQAFSSCAALETIDMPDGVTTLENECFKYCVSLTTVSLSSSLASIGSETFYQCGSLQNVTFKHPNMTIHPNAFSGCGSDIDYSCPFGGSTMTAAKAALGSNPNYYTDATLSGGRLISYTGNLAEVIIPKGFGITAISTNAFSYNGTLTALTISDSVTTIESQIAYQCTKFKTINCNLWSAAYLWTLNHPSYTLHLLDAVVNGHVLTSYTGTGPSLWSEDAMGITAIGDNAFEGNNSVQHITLPNGITSIGKEAFKNCGNLQDIWLPGTLTSIGESAFLQCSALTEIIIPSSVTFLPLQCLSHCTSLSDVYLPDTLTSIGDLAFRWCTNLTELTLPDSLTHLGVSVFASSGLTSLEFPDSLDTIPGGAFFGCTALSNVRIPDSVQSIGDHAFDIYNPENLLFSCNASSYAAEWASDHNIRVIPLDMTIVNGVLTAYTGNAAELIIPSYLGITAIGNSAFEDCHVRHVEIPEGVTSIGNNAFRAAPYLESISLPDSLTSIGYSAFMGCTALVAVSIPESLTEIPHMAFYNCVSLRAATFPNGNVTIIDDAFEGCGEYFLTFYCYSDETNVAQYAWGHHFLVEVFAPFIDADFLLPQNLREVKEEAFMGLPVTGVECNYGLNIIGPRAFANCTSMRFIIIPSTVTSIAPDAFAGCDRRLVIIGYQSSTAEDFANEHGYRFLHD